MLVTINYIVVTIVNAISLPCGDKICISRLLTAAFNNSNTVFSLQFKRGSWVVGKSYFRNWDSSHAMFIFVDKYALRNHRYVKTNTLWCCFDGDFWCVVLFRLLEDSRRKWEYWWSFMAISGLLKGLAGLAVGAALVCNLPTRVWMSAERATVQYLADTSLQAVDESQRQFKVSFFFAF